MEGVEDIPGTALAEGMTWNRETFPQYLDELDRMPRVMDVSALIPHGPVRAYVMGERGGPTPRPRPRRSPGWASWCARPSRPARSASRTPAPSCTAAKDGALAAGTTASADELIAIGLAVGEAGAGVFEVASDMFDTEGEFAWMAADLA